MININGDKEPYTESLPYESTSMVTERWLDGWNPSHSWQMSENQTTFTLKTNIHTIQWYNIIVAVTICARLVPASLEPYRSRIHLSVICCFVCISDYLPFTFDFTCSIPHWLFAHCLGEPYHTIPLPLLTISQPIHDFRSFKRFLFLTHLNISMLCIA